MNTYDLRNVELFVRENGSKDNRRLICAITSGSKFTTMPWFNRLNDCTDDDLIRAAKDQRNGWKFNGPWPNAVFEIVAVPHRGEEYVV